MCSSAISRNVFRHRGAPFAAALCGGFLHLAQALHPSSKHPGRGSPAAFVTGHRHRRAGGRAHSIRFRRSARTQATAVTALPLPLLLALPALSRSLVFPAKIRAKSKALAPNDRYSLLTQLLPKLPVRNGPEYVIRRSGLATAWSASDG